MGRLRVVALNVQSGGGPRARQLADAIAAHDPDLAVVSEAYPKGERGWRLAEAMARVGLRHSAVAISDSPSVASSVAIYSRAEVEAIAQPIASGPNCQRVLGVYVGGVQVVGAYFPLKPLHAPFWRDEFLPYAKGLLGADALLLGDWNTGARDGDAESVMAYGYEEFAALSAMGWADAWRARNPTAASTRGTAASRTATASGSTTPSRRPRSRPASSTSTTTTVPARARRATTPRSSSSSTQVPSEPDDAPGGIGGRRSELGPPGDGRFVCWKGRLGPPPGGV